MTTTPTNNNRFLIVEESVTVTAGAYTAKDAIGGLITIASAVEKAGGAVRIVQAIFRDQAMQSVDLDIVFFDENPSGTTITNDLVVDIADADLAKVKGVLPVTTDCLFSDNGVAFANPSAPPVVRCKGTDLYAVMVARSTPTFAATTDVSVCLVLERV